MHSIIFCPWGGQFLLSCPLIGCDSELFSSLQFSCSVVSDSLQPQGLLQARLHCPSPTPGLTQTHVHWVSDAIQPSHPVSSPFSSCLQFFPASGSFQMSQFLTSGVVSASTSDLPMNIQDLFPLGWTGWISLQSKGLSRVFFNITVLKHQFFGTQVSYSPTLTFLHDYWKNHGLD